MVSCSSILEKKRARESSGIPENGAKKHRKLEEGVHREEDSELVALNGCEIIPECSADESRELQEEDEEEEGEEEPDDDDDEEEEGEEEPDDDDDEEEEGEEEPDEEEEDKTITTRAFSNKEGEVSRKSPPHLKLGSMSFESSLHMFNFFYDLLQVWPIGLNLNKFEHSMLEDLINKGHREAEKKIGAGIKAFQVQMNSLFYSRCYYIIRKDGSITDFSYRNCVDNISALPKEFRARSGDLNLRNMKQQNEWHDNKGRGSKFGGGQRGGHRTSRF